MIVMYQLVPVISLQFDELIPKMKIICKNMKIVCI